MRRSRTLAALVILLAYALPLEAQGLKQKLSDLFKFGPGDVQLFLPGSGDPNNNPFLRAHGSHFLPSAVANNASLIAFVTNAIGGNASNAPISSASGGTTFRFENGVPVSTSISPGPLFAERAQTLGKGRGSFGYTRNETHYKSIRGVSLGDIRVIFTHQNITDAIDPTCSATTKADCTPYGVPAFENDIIRVALNIDLDVAVNSFYLSYGLLDRLDFSIAVPIIETSLKGSSTANIDPFGATANHFFAGTFSNPVLSASTSVFGSASGVGDVAARLKYNLVQGANSGFSLLVDARFPTGSEDDLLGSGHLAVRGLAVVSARYGNFTPHANVGYLKRTGDLQNDAVLATFGFDHLMAPWATLAADLISEFQVGANKLTLPGPVHYDAPFVRTLNPSSIPDVRDDIVNGSFGFKLKTFDSFNTVVNLLVPLNRAGLRPNMAWTVGAEFNF